MVGRRKKGGAVSWECDRRFTLVNVSAGDEKAESVEGKIKTSLGIFHQCPTRRSDHPAHKISLSLLHVTPITCISSGPCEGHCPNWESPLPGLRGTSPVCPWPFAPRRVVGVLGSSNLVGSCEDEALFTGSDKLFLQAGQFDDDTKSLSFCDPSSQPKLTLASFDIGHRWPCAAVCNFGPRYFSDNNAGLLNRRGSPTGPLKANLR